AVLVIPKRQMIRLLLSADFHKYGGIRPAMHPAARRCSSVKYSRYSPSSPPSVRHRIYERQHLANTRSRIGRMSVATREAAGRRGWRVPFGTVESVSPAYSRTRVRCDVVQV